MKKLFVFIMMAAVALSASAASDAPTKEEKKAAVKAAINDHLKFYGFVRNYFSVDSRAVKAGTADLYLWLPKKVDMGAEGDKNATPSYRLLAMTSRFGLDVKGFSAGSWDFGAKLEADFYAYGASNTVAMFRLRQAYLTATWNKCLSFKMGQAWHPLVDLPPITALDSGAPFAPFSRTPQILLTYNAPKVFGLEAAYIYQAQYKSAGPSGASNAYMAHGGFEFYLALKASTEHFTFKAGADLLSIKPRWIDAEGAKLKDRITTVMPFVSVTGAVKGFSFGTKWIYTQAGEHINLMGGYALCSTENPLNYGYTPLQGITANAWMSQDICKGLKAVLFGGYYKNFGTIAECETGSALYYNSNADGALESAFRGSASLIYKPWKFFDFGLEYSVTGANYGTYSASCKNYLPDENLTWAVNHRLELMVRFSW